MKKVLKGIGIAFLCLIVIGNIVKLILRPVYENSFAAQIENANRDCPIPVGLGKGAVTAIHLENGFLAYYLTYDTSFNKVVDRLDADKVKDAMLMCFLCVNAQGNSQGDILLNKLIDENVGLKIYINCGTTRLLECAASPKEIQQLRQRYDLNPHEALYNLLSLSMQAEKGNLPMKVDEGLEVIDYSLEGTNIVITAKADENLYSIVELNINKELIKDAMLKEGLNDAEMKSLLDMCKVSHTGLVYRYIGNRSGKRCDITISSEEIRQRVHTPSSVNIN